MVCEVERVKRNKKRLIVCLSVIAVVIAVIVGEPTIHNRSSAAGGESSLPSPSSLPQSGSLAGVLGVDLSQADGSSVLNGNTGKENMLNREQTQEFLKLFDGVTLKNGTTVSRGTGVSLSVVLYHGRNTLAYFDFGVGDYFFAYQYTEYQLSKSFTREDYNNICKKFDITHPAQNETDTCDLRRDCRSGIK